MARWKVRNRAGFLGVGVGMGVGMRVGVRWKVGNRAGFLRDFFGVRAIKRKF